MIALRDLQNHPEGVWAIVNDTISTHLRIGTRVLVYPRGTFYKDDIRDYLAGTREEGRIMVSIFAPEEDISDGTYLECLDAVHCQLELF